MRTGGGDGDGDGDDDDDHDDDDGDGDDDDDDDDDDLHFHLLAQAEDVVGFLKYYKSKNKQQKSCYNLTRIPLSVVHTSSRSGGGRLASLFIYALRNHSCYCHRSSKRRWHLSYMIRTSSGSGLMIRRRQAGYICSFATCTSAFVVETPIAQAINNIMTFMVIVKIGRMTRC